MTYCCGILVREGMVMIADTRTNAGIDNISTFRKLHIFQQPGQRVMMLATAGNLSITQTVVNYITEGMENPETKELERLLDCESMFAAAELIGRAIRKVRSVHGEILEQENISASTTMLFGGQMKDRRLRLFMIYSAGNFIEATSDTPFLQIGELKYGKPVLDRAVNYETNLNDSLKMSLISMDSTMRSNLSVGLPIGHRRAQARLLRTAARSSYRQRRSVFFTTFATAGRPHCGRRISTFPPRPTAR